MNTNEIKKCISDDNIYTSMPPQNRCKDCGTFWVTGKNAPECKVQKYSDASDIVKSFTNKDK